MNLEQSCPECDGRGIVGGATCGICNGTGRVPSPEGQAILELVEKYGGKPLDTIDY